MTSANTETVTEGDRGITDADLAQIQHYLQKRTHKRSVDDLRPADD